MKGNDFFIDILKAAPIDSTIETTGYINSETAIQLGLIDFKEFIPKNVGLIFKLDSGNISKWIDFFEKAEITDLVTHYWIYKDNAVIAVGFDNFESNSFDKSYFGDKFQKYKDDFQIDFDTHLTNGLPASKRIIEFLRVNDYNGNYSADINLEINNENLNLRFAIEKADYDIISKLYKELQSDDKLFFKGVYLSGKDFQELGVTIKTTKIDIELTIDSTKRFISNLLWFQGLDKKNEIEKLIINCP